MYLSELKLWNFRKYGTKNKKSVSENNPGLIVPFQNGLNLLVGENDSGKTAILDAIKFVIGTQTYESLRLDDKDFFIDKSGKRCNELKVECVFRGFTTEEASHFLEWAGFEETEGECKFVLNVRLNAYRKDNGRIISDVKAGSDSEGVQLDGKARNLLRTTYLKPLRDADQELSSGSRSRLAHILISHQLFKKQKDEHGNPIDHELESILKKANSEIEDYFKNKDGKEILTNINEDNFRKFVSKRKLEEIQSDARINVTGKELSDILRSLNLKIDENKTGLGTQNLLFIATELILLQRNEGLKLCLIEEIEAHLHAQAQIRLIEFLNKKKEQQFILTTHSPNLASKVDLNKIIISKSDNVFPISNSTYLENEDFEFLRRFLDVTKANLFFAEGIIIVEGDAENILVPTIAEIIERPLHEYGVSIINVGSKALLRYAKIFKRSDKRIMHIPVACITDLDIKQSLVDGNVANVKNKNPETEREKLNKLKSEKDGIGVFSSPLWTLEFDLALGQLREPLYQAIYVAQLIKSRTKSQNFKGLTSDEVKDRKEKAIEKLRLIESSFPGNGKRIAFEIYKPIESKKVSKAVVAQYLSSFLLLETAKFREILKTDPQIKYIVKAIEFVTKGYDHN